jgi:hypothetical protein
MTQTGIVPIELLEQAANKLSNIGQTHLSEPLFTAILDARRKLEGTRSDDEALQLAEDFPAYWKPLPEHWRAIDTYRVDDLFPLPSSRLYHARKKLLVPGCRTGGKSVYHDLKEAHRTLGAWLAEQPEHQA